MKVWPGAEVDGGTLPSSGTLDRPFILVEGFDPQNENAPDWYYEQEAAFFDKARKAQSDILILNFADAAADLLENAAVVQRAVRYISSIKTGSTPIRLGGISMGGVIARYALAEAEDRGDPLDVSHYASLDAPHQGAAIDRELLWWVYDPPAVVDTTDIHKLMEFRGTLRTKAAKQMLEYNPYSSGEHDDLMRALRTTNGDGYPKGIQNIGVAFSNPYARHFGSPSKWLTIQVEIDLKLFAPEIHLWFFYVSSGETIGQAGSHLPESFTEGSSNLKRAHAQPTFIPYDSALDINHGHSSFDVQLTAAQGFHNNFPDRHGEPLLYWLEIKEFPLAAATERLGGEVYEGETAEWSASGSGGSGFYEYRWEHWYSSCPLADGDGWGMPDAVQCDEWHAVGAGEDYYDSAPLSPLYNPHKVRVTVSDRYATHLTPAAATSSELFVLPGSRFFAARRGGHEASLGTEQASALEGNYPNPFNASTVIHFMLPAEGVVTLTVYDMAGRAVMMLADRFFAAGPQRVVFDGSRLPSGVYYYTIQAERYAATRSMLLVK